LLVMNQANSKSHYDKGLSGEKYVASKISELGYTAIYIGGCQVYSINGNRFEVVDYVSFKDGRTFWVQVKNKEPRKFYPDTGMELWRYKNLVKYQQKTGLDILVLFTDSSKQIYGEWLNGLPSCISFCGSRQNTKTNTEMIYWLRDKLKDYRDLL